MPTAAKLIGGACFALLVWLVSGLIPPLLPEGTPTGLLQPINAAVGFVMGWTILGRNAGDGLVGTVGHASTTAVAVVFWCLLIWSGNVMLTRSTRLLYDGPIEAVQDMAVVALEYGALVATVEIIAAFIVGTLVAALITERAAERWS